VNEVGGIAAFSFGFAVVALVALIYYAVRIREHLVELLVSSRHNEWYLSKISRAVGRIEDEMVGRR
jgi:hypothetical protein